MHDWTLVSILVDWIKGIVTITFKNYKSNQVILIADGLVNLHIPKREEWGESVSINEVTGPILLSNGNYHLKLEIQSGDKIELEAKFIKMPEA
ncbi:hypothetical protein [Methylobacter tundripaludum]|uniref:Uncharacterized protein n=1 Tax=Methylobacter tundripaludum (strain ATCC BAA-1195 / DSM 17260 / SV96) TaxID=697282 RepID=G3ITW1_METTV|nr:hypothetical protein [Methylobacter tundripaludum]EGW21444.1 hypothetical protein Mettu_0203 [Methylobacter tundripaludum SV96]